MSDILISDQNQLSGLSLASLETPKTGFVGQGSNIDPWLIIGIFLALNFNIKSQWPMTIRIFQF